MLKIYNKEAGRYILYNKSTLSYKDVRKINGDLTDEEIKSMGIKIPEKKEEIEIPEEILMTRKKNKLKTLKKEDKDK